ncbi:pentraxin-4 [Tenrec ecaudatus]|uniref:pentraxin-4 n=1 Tax=Tenrec ecaudatus TaxID=94439 RepID=UPI003F5A0989
MGGLGDKPLCFLLVWMSVYLHVASSQEAGPHGPRRPFLERLRRLEEQFRRLQEGTLARLQAIASNYNLSYNLDVRFQSLEQDSRAMALSMNQSQAAVQADLSHLKTWVRKTQRRGHKVDVKLLALDQALSEASRQLTQHHKEQKAQGTVASSLDVHTLQDTLAGLTRLVHSQGARLAVLEAQLGAARPGPAALHPTPPPPTARTQAQGLSPSPLQPQRTREALLTSTPDIAGHLRAATSHSRRPPEAAPIGRGRYLSCALGSGPGARTRLQGATRLQVCSVGPALVFPNVSTENAVFLLPGFRMGLRALSVCSWVRTAHGRLGTLLSYATEENDNKLVLHGRDSLAPGSVHFVIGDPAFRELPLQTLLDGQWHHLCVIWTAAQGRHWLYVDRRLVATGSRFREGYEIPPGGSLVLGQEQDFVGGGFDSAEAFVGSLAGLAIWGRVLAPGEVSSLATGRVVPAGALLTLANATSDNNENWHALPLANGGGEPERARLELQPQKPPRARAAPRGRRRAGHVASRRRVTGPNTGPRRSRAG